MTPLTFTQRAWLVVALLWPVAVLNYLDRLMITTMHAPLVADIPMRDAQYGSLTSVFLLTYGLLSPLGGFLAARYSRRWVILGSLAVWSAVTVATGRMTSLEGLLVTRAIMGVSEACYIPAALALIADYHRGATRSLATGLHTSGIYTGAALGGLGGVLAERCGWRDAFAVFGGVGVAYAFILLLGLRDAVHSDEEHTVAVEENLATNDKPSWAEAAQALAASTGFWMLFALNALVGTSNWVIYGWLPTYLKERFSLGLGEAGMSATAYFQIASFAAALGGGALTDAWSRTQSRARAIVPAIGY